MYDNFFSPFIRLKKLKQQSSHARTFGFFVFHINIKVWNKMRVNRNDQLNILKRTIALIKIRTQAVNSYALWYNHPRINLNSRVLERDSSRNLHFQLFQKWKRLPSGSNSKNYIEICLFHCWLRLALTGCRHSDNALDKRTTVAKRGKLVFFKLARLISALSLCINSIISRATGSHTYCNVR